jgi:hypothetical protein
MVAHGTAVPDGLVHAVGSQCRSSAAYTLGDCSVDNIALAPTLHGLDHGYQALDRRGKSGATAGT